MKMNKLFASVSAIAFAVGVSASAQAAVFNGEGASLPERAYTGNVNATATPPAPIADSIFGQYNADPANAAHQATYAGTGSGAGKSSIIANTKQFAGTDSPFTQQNYADFLAGAGGTAHVKPVQVPAIAGSVAVVYNIGASTATINLTSVQLAKIFTGLITNWNQVGGPNLAIKLVGRTSGSGTTFSFLNHLNKVIQTNLSQFPSKNILVKEVYTAGVTTPSTTKKADGTDIKSNQDLITVVNATAGAIGYAEAANAYATTGTKIAQINSLLPTTPTTTFVTDANIVVGGAIDGATNNPDGSAKVVTLTGTPASVTLVNPSAYANPAGGYPIVAISYLLTYTNNNGDAAKVAALKRLINSPSTKFSLLSTNAKKGFSALPVTTKVTTAINQIVN